MHKLCPSPLAPTFIFNAKECLILAWSISWWAPWARRACPHEMGRAPLRRGALSWERARPLWANFWKSPLQLKRARPRERGRALLRWGALSCERARPLQAVFEWAPHGPPRARSPGKGRAPWQINRQLELCFFHDSFLLFICASFICALFILCFIHCSLFICALYSLVHIFNSIECC